MLSRRRPVRRRRQGLKLDHATVSRRTAALEATIGAKLFDRRTTGAKLTGAGERFIGAAVQMESAFLHAPSEISGVDLELAGDVHIGAPATRLSDNVQERRLKIGQRDGATRGMGPDPTAAKNTRDRQAGEMKAPRPKVTESAGLNPTAGGSGAEPLQIVGERPPGQFAEWGRKGPLLAKQFCSAGAAGFVIGVTTSAA